MCIHVLHKNVRSSLLQCQDYGLLQILHSVAKHTDRHLPKRRSHQSMRTRICSCLLHSECVDKENPCNFLTYFILMLDTEKRQDILVKHSRHKSIIKFLCFFHNSIIIDSSAKVHIWCLNIRYRIKK